MQTIRKSCRRIFAAGLGVAFLLNASSAYAAGDGPYVSLTLGLAVNGDVDGSDGITTSIGPGIASNLALGYRTGGFRFEAEIGGQNYSFEGQTVDGAQVFSDLDPDPGSLLIGMLMGNLFYEFDTDSRIGSDDGAAGISLRPYIGVGAGMAKISADYIYSVPGSGAANCAILAGLCAAFPFLFSDEKVILLDDSDWVVAYQAIAGISFEVWDATDILLQYRFLATQNAEFTFTDGTPFHQDGILSHSFQLGVRYFF